MPKFSNRSIKKLETCHEDIQKIMYKAIKIIDFSVLRGYSSPEMQFELYKKGRHLQDGCWVKVGKYRPDI